MRVRNFLPLTIFAAMLAARCDAADSVQVTFETFDCILCSDEMSELRIVRQDSPAADRQQPVDGYFQLVADALRKGQVSPKWDPGMPLHSDTITVKVTLGKDEYRWCLGWKDGGLRVPLNESESDRRQRTAIAEVIQASLNHFTKRFGHESQQ